MGECCGEHVEWGRVSRMGNLESLIGESRPQSWVEGITFKRMPSEPV